MDTAILLVAGVMLLVVCFFGIFHDAQRFSEFRIPCESRGGVALVDMGGKNACVTPLL